jgi:hypothetical protein
MASCAFLVEHGRYTSGVTIQPFMLVAELICPSMELVCSLLPYTRLRIQASGGSSRLRGLLCCLGCLLGQAIRLLMQHPEHPRNLLVG